MSDENISKGGCAPKDGRRAFHRFVIGTTALLSIYVAAGFGEARAAEEQAWTPAVGLFGSLLVNEADGDVRSTVRPDAADNDLFIDPAIGLTAELMTPSIAPRSTPMNVRLLVHAGVGAGFAFERSLAKELNPGEFDFPEVRNPPPAGQNVSPNEVSGRGSSTKAQPQPWLVLAGAGVALGFELWGRPLRIKPSIEYRLDEIEVRGLVAEVTGTRTVFPDGSISPDFRQIRLEARDSKRFHSLGPGIELELDTTRISDFMLSLFVSARAWSVLGDRDIEMRESCCSATGPTESTTWRYERDRWSYGSTVGLRLRWVPED